MLEGFNGRCLFVVCVVVFVERNRHFLRVTAGRLFLFRWVVCVNRCRVDSYRVMFLVVLRLVVLCLLRRLRYRPKLFLFRVSETGISLRRCSRVKVSNDVRLVCDWRDVFGYFVVVFFVNVIRERIVMVGGRSLEGF